MPKKNQESNTNNAVVVPFEAASLKALTKSDFATAKGNYFHVRPEALIIDPEYNARVDYGDIAELERQIQGVGRVKEPLTVEFKEGRLSIIEGHRRFRAVNNLIAKGVEIPTVPVLVEAMEEVEKIADLIVSNDGKNLNMVEQGIVFKRLEDTGLKRKEISEKTGKTQAHISNCVRLLDLPESVHKVIFEGRLSAANALAVYRENGNDPEKTEKAVEKLLEDAKADGKDKATQKTIDKSKNGKKVSTASSNGSGSNSHDVNDISDQEIPLRVFNTLRELVVKANNITEPEGTLVLDILFNHLGTEDKKALTEEADSQ